MPPTVNSSVADIAKAIWQSVEFFPVMLATNRCKPYVLSLCFLRALSSMQNSPNGAWQQCGLLVPLDAQMDVLFALRAQAGNAARLDKALHALTFLNPVQLGSQLLVHPFDSPVLGNEIERDELLRALLCHFEQVDVLVSKVDPSQRTPHLWGEIFSEVLRLFACHHSASTHFIVAPPAVKLDTAHVTPRPVAHLMVRLLDPMPHDSIYDPLCGVGNILLNCAQWIAQVHHGKPKILFGHTFTLEQAAITRMHLALYGVDTTHVTCASDDDAQTKRCPRITAVSEAERATLFDVVLCAPPLSHYLAGQHVDNSASHGNDSGIGMGLALNMLARMKPNTGRMAILLPLAALTRSDQREMRKELVLANAIDSVILLPPCLLPHYPAAAAVVFMRREAGHAPVYLVDARMLTATSPQSNEQVMARIEQAFLPKGEQTGFSCWVSNKELEAKKYDFTAVLHGNVSQKINVDEGGVFIIHPHSSLSHDDLTRLDDDNADMLCIQ